MKSLIDRLSEGDAGAFAELYDLMGNRLYRYVISILGNSNDAVEVIQDVFVRLFRFHRKFSRVEHLDAYVFKIARNESLRWISKSRRSIESTPEIVRSECPTLDQVEWIDSLLEKLGPIDQEIVRCKIFGELSFQEIGAISKMPPASVATRYRRAMMRLQSAIERQEMEEKRGLT